MFSRYLRPLKNLGYDVTYACSPELKGFLRLSPDLDDIELTSEIPDTKVFDYRAFSDEFTLVNVKFSETKT